MNDFEAWERIVDELGDPIIYILECGKRYNITLPNRDRRLNGSVMSNAITDYYKVIIHQLNPNNGIKQLMNRYF
jgi:hypothetical protein